LKKEGGKIYNRFAMRWGGEYCKKGLTPEDFISSFLGKKKKRRGLARSPINKKRSHYDDRGGRNERVIGCIKGKIGAFSN